MVSIIQKLIGPQLSLMVTSGKVLEQENVTKKWTGNTPTHWKTIYLSTLFVPVLCVYIYIYIYLYIHTRNPKWALVWKPWPIKWRLCPPKPGSTLTYKTPAGSSDHSGLVKRSFQGLGILGRRWKVTLWMSWYAHVFAWYSSYRDICICVCVCICMYIYIYEYIYILYYIHIIHVLIHSSNT